MLALVSVPAEAAEPFDQTAEIMLEAERYFYWKELSRNKQFGRVDRSKLKMLLEEACTIGDPIGCAYLAFVLSRESDESRGTQLMQSALPDLRKLCDQDNFRACRTLGLANQPRRGPAPSYAIEGPQAYSQTVSLYTKACDGGDAIGCSHLGHLYRLGWGVTEDPQEAARRYIQACYRGSVVGCNSLGSMYQYGRGVTKDLRKAVGLYTKACDLGHCNELVSLAWRYAKGDEGVTKDPQRAVSLYTKACRFDLSACSAVGRMYYYGEGVTKDFQRAVSYFAKTCDARSDESCVLLGHIYANGDGVTKDLQKAGSLYTKACDLGHCNELVSLARRYAKGDEGVTKDPQRAVSLYTKACDAPDGKGVSEACDYLGTMYYYGEGVTKDRQRAVSLYTKACDGRDALCSNLGVMLENGEGVTKDLQRAISLYTKACDAAGGGARLLFGLDARGGRGCTNLGIMYYGKAAGLTKRGCLRGYGNFCAIANYGTKALPAMHENGEGVARDLVNRFRLYEEACEKDGPRSCIELVAENIGKAAGFFKLGCLRGDEIGCKASEELGTEIGLR